VAGAQHPTTTGVAGTAVPSTRLFKEEDAGPIALTVTDVSPPIDPEAVAMVTGVAIEGGVYVEITISFQVEVTEPTWLNLLQCYPAYVLGGTYTSAGQFLKKLGSSPALESMTLTGLVGPLSAGTYDFGLAAEVIGIVDTPAVEVEFTQVTVRSTVITL
jgi:hypothetical protein